MSITSPPPPGPSASDTTPPAAAADPLEPKRKKGFWRWIRSNRRWAIALIPVALIIGIGIGANGAPVEQSEAYQDLALALDKAERQRDSAEGRVERLEGKIDAADKAMADAEALMAEAEERTVALDARATELDDAEAAKRATQFGDGVYLVGTDIQPGMYRNDGQGSCYWARRSGVSGDFGEILANDNVDGPAVVAIVASDVAFQSSRCGTWTKID